MLRLIKALALAFTFAMLWAGAHAHAEARMGTNTSDQLFKSDGKVVTAAQAVDQARDHEIERCSPIKGAVNAEGKTVVIYKCKVVVLEYNPRTGMPHWKAK